MGQQDILDFLEKHPDEWFRSTEIAKALGITGNICNPLRSLREHEDVQVKNTHGQKNHPMYMYKHKE